MTTMVSRAIRMKHTEDPKQVLINESKDAVEWFEPQGDLVMLGVYVRGGEFGKEQKSAGGIILTGNTKAEDNFQGKIGLVLKKGPLAYVEDETHKWKNPPKIHDWVVYRVGDTWPYIIGDKTYRLISDVDIRAVWSGPPDALI